MDLSVLRSVPIGLVMFGVMAWGYIRRRARRNATRSGYPALAERLGLEHRRPTRINDVGQLHGVWRGYRICVDPDEQRKIIVRFAGEPLIDLRSYEVPRCPVGMKTFGARDRAVNAYFRTRYASDAIAERLNEADLVRLTLPFSRDYRHAVRDLNITQHGVTCTLDFGNPPHIPTQAILELLPALIDWAEVIEPSPADS